MYGVEKANVLGLELWEQVYPTHTSNELHIALTDTYTSEAFFKVSHAHPHNVVTLKIERKAS